MKSSYQEVALRHTLHKTFVCAMREEPLPLDVYGELLRYGLDPEGIMALFMEGKTPGELVIEIRERDSQ